VLGGEEWNNKEAAARRAAQRHVPRKQFILLTLIATRQPIF
jgi:hypothetical protein